MECTQTSPMFISLTQTEEANLSGGEVTANSTAVVTNGTSGQDGADGKDGASVVQGGVLNLQSSRLILINRRKELLERLSSRLRSLRKR
ncbi:hypothetical protein CK516_12125 [Nostoc sp. 'Peltigera malacea cyanobiont' DB3992]|nr:hypothetical protein CK516_12125 [Nostoc sp. 'Peltigera malacea cyanobiont' DB3992]